MRATTKFRTLLTAMTLFCCLFFLNVQAGPPGDPGDPGDPGGDPGGDTNTPIDGGLSLLVAAGIGYGIKKVHDKRKNDKIMAGGNNDSL